MDLVGLWIMLGFLLGNFIGLGLYHWTYKKQYPEKGYWKDHVEFWLFTIICTFAGVSYLGIRGIVALINWIRSLK